MDRARLFSQISEFEDELVKVAESIGKVRQTDSMEGWFTEVLSSDQFLVQKLNLPVDENIKGALLVILNSNVELKHPLVNLLAGRMTALLSTLTPLHSHPLRGPRLDNIKSNFEHLTRLLAKYDRSVNAKRTIASVSDALTKNRLQIFKASATETDLWIALRSFHEDKSRDDKRAIDRILAFILDQLRQEVKQANHIPQPRQAWWAVLTLFQEGSDSWLAERRLLLNRIVKHLLDRIPYLRSRPIDLRSIVSDLYSHENEETWVTVNSIRLYTAPSAHHLNATNASLLAKSIEDRLSSILQDHPVDENLKMLQGRLVLLYEAVGYYNLQYTAKLVQQKRIDLRSAKIGSYYYDDAVLQSFAAIQRVAYNLISDPKKWTKTTLSSILISGGPGQGKSELAKQIVAELQALSLKENRNCEYFPYSIGTNINGEADLTQALERIEQQETDNPETLRIVLFDEFDKAKFDFYVRFLELLERQKDRCSTFWLFAQSKCPTFKMLEHYANTLDNKSMRDFLTRMNLGKIDLPDLKISPQQRIYAALGMALTSNSNLSRVQRGFVTYISLSPGIQNLRQLRQTVTHDAVFSDGSLSFNTSVPAPLLVVNRKVAMSDWMKLVV